jgi:hypothetical protein
MAFSSRLLPRPYFPSGNRRYAAGGIRFHSSVCSILLYRQPFDPFCSRRLISNSRDRKALSIVSAVPNKQETSSKLVINSVSNPETMTNNISVKDEQEEVEEYEEVSWLTDRVESTKEFTANIVHRTPGPRIRNSDIPWLIALPALYFSITFVIAIFKTVRKWGAPKAQRRRLVRFFLRSFFVHSIHCYVDEFGMDRCRFWSFHSIPFNRRVFFLLYFMDFLLVHLHFFFLDCSLSSCLFPYFDAFILLYPALFFFIVFGFRFSKFRSVKMQLL